VHHTLPSLVSRLLRACPRSAGRQCPASVHGAATRGEYAPATSPPSHTRRQGKRSTDLQKILDVTDLRENWLPEPEKTRTSRPPLNLPQFVTSTSSDSGSSARLRHAFSASQLRPKPQLVPAPREPPIKHARRFQAMLDSGLAANRTDIARIEGCSRAWVTKVLSGHR